MITCQPLHDFTHASLLKAEKNGSVLGIIIKIRK